MSSESEDSPKKYLPKKWFWIGLTIVISAGLAAGAYYKFVYSGYFPHSIRQQVKIALYYPVNPPPGMQVDRTSFKIPDKNVLTYLVTDKDDNKFYVSVQPLPTNFDFSKFKSKFPKTNELATNAGQALVGDLGSQIIASIPTPKNSWIIVTTQAFSQQPELEALCRSFVQTK